MAMTTREPAAARELSGKVALVTGGRPQHRRCDRARAACRGGADVMVNALHAHADVDETVRARSKPPARRKAASHVADVTDPDCRRRDGGCDRGSASGASTRS